MNHREKMRELSHCWDFGGAALGFLRFPWNSCSVRIWDSAEQPWADFIPTNNDFPGLSFGGFVSSLGEEFAQAVLEEHQDFFFVIQNCYFCYFGGCKNAGWGRDVPHTKTQNVPKIPQFPRMSLNNFKSTLPRHPKSALKKPQNTSEFFPPSCLGLDPVASTGGSFAGCFSELFEDGFDMFAPLGVGRSALWD